jgi:hypothetical protein
VTDADVVVVVVSSSLLTVGVLVLVQVVVLVVALEAAALLLPVRRFRNSVSSHVSKTDDSRLVVIPPTIRLTKSPDKKGYCSSKLIPISRIQYSIAERFLPNLSISGPVMGVVTAPVTNPNAYKLATLNPYDSYKTYKCVPVSYHSRGERGTRQRETYFSE